MITILSIVAMLLTWVPDAQYVRFGAAMALLWLLPGVAWALTLDGDWFERTVLGFGLAFVVNGLATLLLHFIPGAFPITWARLVYLMLALLPGVWTTYRCRIEETAVLPHTIQARKWNAGVSLAGERTGRLRSRLFSKERGINFTPRFSVYALLAVVLIAGLVRFLNLGYSEFQGDEAVIMRRAAQMLAGDDQVLCLHQKGPVEILTPMALWALTGTLNEGQARAPFALMGVLAVAACAALGTRWFGARAGLCAGLLGALGGFGVAFGRIVQYQNFVIAMGALGLLALTLYAQHGRFRDLILSALLVAYGLLAHYDAVLVAPAAFWLWGTGFVRRRATWRCETRRVLAAALVGLAVLGLFYVPFVLNPMFSRTFVYLSDGRMGSGGVFHNSIRNLWVLSTFYNALYYVVGLVLLIVIGAVRKGQPVVAWLYGSIPFLFYSFLVIDPRTHIYTIYPGAVILAGATLAWLWKLLWPKHRLWAFVFAEVISLWYIVCAGYIYIAYINHAPEYKREWPASRHPLYPTTFELLPLYGHFGFPYRVGWKAVEMLFAQGVFEGTYASNEEPEITTWYVRSAARTMCGNPDYYIVAVNVQDVVDIDMGELERDYTLAAWVTAAGRPKISVYQRGVLNRDPFTVAVEDVSAAFDVQTTVAAQTSALYRGMYPVNMAFGDVGHLSGYDLSSAQVRRGELLIVTLYWEALSAPALNYQVFTHVVADGILVAQHDGAPACTHRPTSHWEPGEIVRDEHAIRITASVPPGQVALYTGMYDLLTFAPLPVESGENAVFLQQIEVLP